MPKPVERDMPQKLFAPAAGRTMVCFPRHDIRVRAEIPFRRGREPSAGYCNMRTTGVIDRSLAAVWMAMSWANRPKIRLVVAASSGTQ